MLENNQKNLFHLWGILLKFYVTYDSLIDYKYFKILKSNKNYNNIFGNFSISIYFNF